MNKLIAALFLLFTAIPFCRSQSDALSEVAVVRDSVVSTSVDRGDNIALWESANKAFMSGQYPLAVADYEAILANGMYSAKLYYNLGNAYFQQGQLGKAILNYTRAYNLNPGDEDMAYNLQLAKARTKDKIEPVPQFFLKQWLLSVGGLFSSDLWAFISVVCFLVVAGGVLLWLISNSMTLRKLGFFMALLFAVLFASSLSYSQMAAWQQNDEQGAIVMNTAAPVKSSPASGGKDLFVLHEGTYVRVLQTLDQWSEIAIEDGNKGWINSRALESVGRQR